MAEINILTPATPEVPAAVPVLRAALWMLGAIASLSAIAVAGRAVSGDLDTFEINMYRSLIGLFIMIGLISARRRWQEIHRRNMGLHILRNCAHFTGQNLWFYALPLIPLAQVFALEFTAPIWVLILSPLLLGERLTRIRVIAAMMGFAGVLIVTRPGAESLSIGVITAALSAIGFGLTYIFTKRLTRENSPYCILFWLSVIQSVLGVIAAGYDADVALPVLSALPWLLLIGICGITAHLCIISALAIAPATVVSPIEFVRLPVIAVVGLLFYNEAVDLWVLIGALIIFAGNYLNLWSETGRRQRRAARKRV